MNLHVVSTLLLVLHWSIISVLSLRVIMRRVPVGVSLAWLAVIISVPFAGAAVYLMFGEKRLGRRRAARAVAVGAAARDWKATLPGVPTESGDRGESLQHHAWEVLGEPVLPGNDLQLLDDFGAVFDALIADIDAAERTCHLAFYIWHAGGRAEDVVAALVRAAGRGVSCRVMADALGSKEFLEGPLVKTLRAAGVELAVALRTGPLRAVFARADLRNHRKIGVIDDRVAYTGSQNLVDPRFFKQDSGVGQWVDAMVRVTGPAVSALDGVFAHDWAIETGTPFDPPPLPADSRSAGSAVQVVPSGPAPRPELIHQLMLTAIFSARERLVLTTPYLVPDEAILTALVSAALRGVEVTLVVPERNDSLLVRYASEACYDDLLAAGVHVGLFKGGLLHTKSLTVDGEVAIFGSVNLDMRSLWLNFEISLFVYDPDFTGRLAALQERCLADSDRLDRQVWARRSFGHRLAENAIRLVGPLL